MSQQVITFHYTLTNQGGETLDSSAGGDPLTFLTGGGQIIPGLEVEIVKLKTGDKKKISVKASEAYGDHDDSLVVTVPRDRLPNTREIVVGDRFQAGGEGEGVFTVTAISLENVTLDGNHPLAGQDLFFDVEITSMRAATEEELSHGHAHGGDGHHH